MKAKQCVDIIGAPLDFGANIEGARHGPEALRETGLIATLENLGWQIGNDENLHCPSNFDRSDKKSTRKLIIETCNKLAHKVKSSLDRGHFPLTLGGDHSLAMGSIAGSSAWCQANNKKLGLIWVDAHADMNTDQSSPSGNLHGMPLAASLGMGSADLCNIYQPGTKVLAAYAAVVGIRAVDSEEKSNCLRSGLNLYSMQKIDDWGMPRVIKDLEEKIISQVDALHVSFDIDGLDPVEAPGVSTPEYGGLSSREARRLLEVLGMSEKVIAADFVELNPSNDKNGITAKLAVQMLSNLVAPYYMSFSAAV